MANGLGLGRDTKDRDQQGPGGSALTIPLPAARETQASEGGGAAPATSSPKTQPSEKQPARFIPNIQSFKDKPFASALQAFGLLLTDFSNGFNNRELLAPRLLAQQRAQEQAAQQQAIQKLTMLKEIVSIPNPGQRELLAERAESMMPGIMDDVAELNKKNNVAIAKAVAGVTPEVGQAAVDVCNGDLACVMEKITDGKFEETILERADRRNRSAIMLKTNAITTLLKQAAQQDENMSETLQALLPQVAKDGISASEMVQLYRNAGLDLTPSEERTLLTDELIQNELAGLGFGFQPAAELAEKRKAGLKKLGELEATQAFRGQSGVGQRINEIAKFPFETASKAQLLNFRDELSRLGAQAQIGADNDSAEAANVLLKNIDKRIENEIKSDLFDDTGALKNETVNTIRKTVTDMLNPRGGFDPETGLGPVINTELLQLATERATAIIVDPKETKHIPFAAVRAIREVMAENPRLHGPPLDSKLVRDYSKVRSSDRWGLINVQKTMALYLNDAVGGVNQWRRFRNWVNGLGAEIGLTDDNLPFGSTADAQAAVARLNNILRTVFSVSERKGVWEQQLTLEQLPDEKRIFTSPSTEFPKLRAATRALVDSFNYHSMLLGMEPEDVKFAWIESMTPEDLEVAASKYDNLQKLLDPEELKRLNDKMEELVELRSR